MSVPFPSDLVLIGGEWRAAAGGRTLPVEDPSTGAIVGAIARAGAVDVDAAVGAARAAFDGEFGRLAGFERGRRLAALGRLVLAHGDELAALETLDVGKPSSQARADVTALARYLEFYGGAADKLHGSTLPYLNDYTIYALREPHGVTAHIIPWNYPMQIIGRSVGAALAAGNAVVIKPAEEASLTTLALARLASEAGFPAGAINVVPGLGEEAGAALAAHPGVNHVSFTGSVEVGIAVQTAAARHVAPVTLELGGKSPQLLFDDADLETALPVLIRAGLQNAGQTCSASSRLLLQRGIYTRVVDELARRKPAHREGKFCSQRQTMEHRAERKTDHGGGDRTAKDDDDRVFGDKQVQVAAQEHHCHDDDDTGDKPGAGHNIHGRLQTRTRTHRPFWTVTQPNTGPRSTNPTSSAIKEA